MTIVRRDSSIITWLNIISLMVFAMVFIGGITRLTDSGLSMVDWKPIMGIIPPLTEMEWQQTFAKYQQFPEYKLINVNMTLDGFKAIFFWEYFHRLFGRLIGLAFFFPYLYFFFKKALDKSLNRKLILAFILGGSQGLLGWYMVKSGLVNKPDVSHYRLAAHLGLAFIIISYLYWINLTIKYPDRKVQVKAYLSKPLLIFSVLLTMQITYGAFVAGLDAGLTHNTFPKMGRHWVPSEFTMAFGNFVGFFENTVVVQFIHRCLAWSLALLGIFIFFKNKKSPDFMQKKSINLMLIMLLVQFVLGVLTLINYVPVSLGSLHQVGACALLLLIIRSLFFTLSYKEN